MSMAAMMTGRDERALMRETLDRFGSIRGAMLAQASAVRSLLAEARLQIGPAVRELVGDSISSAFIATGLTTCPGFMPYRASLDERELALYQTRWTQDGCPIYQLSEALTSSLVLTDPDRVPTGALCWPFDAFLIEVPPGFFTVQGVHGPVEEAQLIVVHRYRGVWTEGPEDVGCNPDTALAAAVADRALRAGEYRASLEFLREFRQRLVLEAPEERQAVTLRLLGRGGSCIYRRDALPGKDEPVGRWYGDSRGRAGLTEDEYRMSQVVGRLVANLLIYLQTRIGPLPARRLRDKSVPRPKARRNRPAPPEPEPIATLYEIGHEVQLPRVLREAAHARAHAGRCPARWKLMRRQVVVGHTKWQACGAKWSEHRLITVAPYERYKDAVAQATRVFKVSTPEERVR